MGLVPAMVLGSLRFLLAEGPERTEELVGNIAIALVYTSPYVLTLIVSREKSPALRGGLLSALGLLSFVASFSAMSLISLVLLPATFVIWFAAVRSLTASVRPMVMTFLGTLAGLLVAVTVGFSFFAQFGIQDDEDRCWVLSHDSDGQSRWESRPNVGGPGGLSAGPLSGGPAMVTYDGGVTWQRVGPLVSSRGHCTSDIISNTEAFMSMGILAVAFLGTVLILRIGRDSRRLILPNWQLPRCIVRCVMLGVRRTSKSLTRVVLGLGRWQYLVGTLAVGLLAFAIMEINTAYLRDFLSVSIYGTRPHRIPCDDWPTRDEVEQTLKQHTGVIRRIEFIGSGSVDLSINTWSCPGKAELYIYYPAKRHIKTIRTIIGNEKYFFGVPYTLRNY